MVHKVLSKEKVHKTSVNYFICPCGDEVLVDSFQSFFEEVTCFKCGRHYILNPDTKEYRCTGYYCRTCESYVMFLIDTNQQEEDKSYKRFCENCATNQLEKCEQEVAKLQDTIERLTNGEVYDPENLRSMTKDDDFIPEHYHCPVIDAKSGEMRELNVVKLADIGLKDELQWGVMDHWGEIEEPQTILKKFEKLEDAIMYAYQILKDTFELEGMCYGSIPREIEKKVSKEVFDHESK